MKRSQMKPINLVIDMKRYKEFEKAHLKEAARLMKMFKKMGLFEALADPNRK